MKRIIFLLLLSLVLVGCSSNEGNSNISMDSIISAFESESVEVDPEEKPLFDMIGASDGIIFYNDDNVVKAYEFDSKDAMDNVEEHLPAAKDWDKNGLFLLETNHEESKEIFNNIK